MDYYRGYIKTVGRNLKAAVALLGGRCSVGLRRLGSGLGTRLRGWWSGLAPLRLVALAVTGLLVLVLGAYLMAPGGFLPGPPGSEPTEPPSAVQAEAQGPDTPELPGEADGFTDEGTATTEAGAAPEGTLPADPQDAQVTARAAVPVESDGAADAAQGGDSPPSAGDEGIIPDRCRPAAGPVVRPFGWYFSPTLQEWRFHPGVDIGARTGTPVRSIAAGEVEVVTAGDCGLTVGVRLADGSLVLYAPCQDVAVRPGSRVACGQQLATVGAAAGLEVADPPHLHLEISDRDGEVVDPRPYLP